MTRSKRIYPPPIRVIRICVYARVYVFVCVCFVEKKEKAVNNIPPIGRRWGRVAKKSYLQKLYTAIRETEKRFACRGYFFFSFFLFNRGIEGSFPDRWRAENRVFARTNAAAIEETENSYKEMQVYIDDATCWDLMKRGIRIYALWFCVTAVKVTINTRVVACKNKYAILL